MDMENLKIKKINTEQQSFNFVEEKINPTHLFPSKMKIDPIEDLDTFLKYYKPIPMANFQEYNNYNQRGYKIIIDYDSSDFSILKNILSRFSHVVFQNFQIIRPSNNFLYLITKRPSSGHYHVHFLNMICNSKELYKKLLTCLKKIHHAVDEMAGVNFFLTFGAYKAYEKQFNKKKDFYEPLILFAGDFDQIANEKYEIDVSKQKYESIYNTIKSHLPDRTSFLQAVSLLRPKSDYDYLLIDKLSKEQRIIKNRNSIIETHMQADHIDEESDESNGGGSGEDKLSIEYAKFSQDNTDNTDINESIDAKDDKLKNREKLNFLELMLFTISPENLNTYKYLFCVSAIIARYFPQPKGIMIYLKLFKNTKHNKRGVTFIQDLYISNEARKTMNLPLINLKSILAKETEEIRSFEKIILEGFVQEDYTLRKAILSIINRNQYIFTFVHPQNRNHLLTVSYDEASKKYIKIVDTTRNENMSNIINDNIMEIIQPRVLMILNYLKLKHFQNMTNYSLFSKYSKIVGVSIDSKKYLKNNYNSECFKSGEKYYQLHIFSKIIKMRTFLARHYKERSNNTNEEDSIQSNNISISDVQNRWHELSTLEKKASTLLNFSNENNVFNFRISAQEAIKHTRYTDKQISALKNELGGYYDQGESTSYHK